MDRMKKLNYTTKNLKKENNTGCWDSLIVEIYKDDNKVGEYIRNYFAMYNTFYPFELNEKEYALYSHNYQTVSLMSLPDCKLIAEHASGFCPVDFAIPREDGDDYFMSEHLKENDFMGKFAVAAGCVWGDDSGGWKIQAVDLSHINEGKLEVKPLFGYFESCYTGNLEDALEWSSDDGFHRVSLPMKMEFQIDENDVLNSGFLGYNIKDIKHYKGKNWDNFNVVKTYDRDKEIYIGEKQYRKAKFFERFFCNVLIEKHI